MEAEIRGKIGCLDWGKIKQSPATVSAARVLAAKVAAAVAAKSAWICWLEHRRRTSALRQTHAQCASGQRLLHSSDRVSHALLHIRESLFAFPLGTEDPGEDVSAAGAACSLRSSSLQPQVSHLQLTSASACTSVTREERRGARVRPSFFPHKSRGIRVTGSLSLLSSLIRSSKSPLNSS